MGTAELRGLFRFLVRDSVQICPDIMSLLWVEPDIVAGEGPKEDLKRASQQPSQVHSPHSVLPHPGANLIPKQPTEEAFTQTCFGSYSNKHMNNNGEDLPCKEYLVSARLCAMLFICIVPCQKEVLLLSSLYRWGNWGPERRAACPRWNSEEMVRSGKDTKRSGISDIVRVVDQYMRWSAKLVPILPVRNWGHREVLELAQAHR